MRIQFAGKAWALVLLAARLLGATAAEPEPILSWHFVGTKQLATLQELASLQQILALPESAALRDAAVETLGQRLADRSVRGQEGPALAARAELAEAWRSLLPDLVREESRFELDRTAGNQVLWILAVKLNEERAGQWSRTLAKIAAGTGLKTTPAPAGWTAGRPGYQLSFATGKDWTIVQGGAESGPAVFKNFRAELEKGAGRSVLKARLEWSRLAEMGGRTGAGSYPKIALQVTPRRDGLHSEMTIEYPKDLGLAVEKWDVPVQSIREPLIGFTAVRGVGPHLEKAGLFRQFEVQKTPNQLFFWAQRTSPFSVLGAARVGASERVIDRFAANLPPLLAKPPIGEVLRLTNRTALHWRGLPIIVPYLEVAPDPEFVVAGFYPVANPSTNTIPSALLEELNQPNLVYYDWEITDERLRQWKPLWQLRHIVGGQAMPKANSASEKWLDAVSSKLGNTITQGVLTGPRRIEIARQSHAGFSALELTLLAHWLDAHDTIAFPSAPAPSRPGTKAAAPLPPPAAP